MSGWRKTILLVWFHIGWFGCVYCEQCNWPEASLIFPLVSWALLAKWHLLTLKQTSTLVLLAILGAAFDAVANYSGFIFYSTPPSFLMPVWLLSMWLLFVSVLPLAFAFFASRLALAAVMGAIFGPLSYYSGSSFGVLHLNGAVAIFVYGIFWAVYFPVCFILLRKRL